MFTIHQRTLEYWKDKDHKRAFTFYIESHHPMKLYIDTEVVLQVKNE